VVQPLLWQAHEVALDPRIPGFRSGCHFVYAARELGEHLAERVLHVLLLEALLQPRQRQRRERRIADQRVLRRLVLVVRRGQRARPLAEFLGGALQPLARTLASAVVAGARTHIARPTLVGLRLPGGGGLFLSLFLSLLLARDQRLVVRARVDGLLHR